MGTDITHWLELLISDFGIKSRYELSKKTSVSETTLSNIANRKTSAKSVKVDVVARLAKGLDISMDELYAKIASYENKAE